MTTSVQLPNHAKIQKSVFILTSILFFFSILISFAQNSHIPGFAGFILLAIVTLSIFSFKKINTSVKTTIFSVWMVIIMNVIVILFAIGPAKQTVEPLPSNYFEQAE